MASLKPSSIGVTHDNSLAAVSSACAPAESTDTASPKRWSKAQQRLSFSITFGMAAAANILSKW